MPRPLNEQVVVITGASSGIGRATALRFGAAGASVVLAARHESALRTVAHEVRQAGGQAHVVVTDVAEWEQVQHLAEEAVSRFRYIDTWVNCAGVALYSLFEDTTVDEFNRVIQVNLMGVVFGSKAALSYMRPQGFGTIINIASVLGKRSVPLQAAYSAAEHGVKGFSEALRLEAEREQDGVHVTTVFPASINTPFFDHARSKIGVKPNPIPPVYSPDLVVDAIVRAAVHPTRDLYPGRAGRLFTWMQRLSPALVDRLMLLGDYMVQVQRTDEPDDGRDNLFVPGIESDPSWRASNDGKATGVSGSLWRRVMLLPAVMAGAAWIWNKRGED